MATTRKTFMQVGALAAVGANPQLSIDGIGARLAGTLAHTLTGKPAPRVSS